VFACTSALECVLDLGFMIGVLLLGWWSVEFHTVQVTNGQCSKI